MRYAIVVLVLLAGCARYMGTGAPTPEFSEYFGCDHEEILATRKARAERIRPQVGMTACDVLAYWGMPTDLRMHETSYGRASNWWYPDSLGTPYKHTLTVRQQEDGWVVDYVSW